MKLHTKLSIGEVYNSLLVTKARGLMTEDIYFSQITEQKSRTHPHGYLIQLATRDQRSGPTNSRHYKHPDTKPLGGRERMWAATHDEWGWFIADIFERDPNAKWSRWESADYFHEVTGGKYKPDKTPLHGMWVNELHP